MDPTGLKHWIHHYKTTQHWCKVLLWLHTREEWTHFQFENTAVMWNCRHQARARHIFLHLRYTAHPLQATPTASHWSSHSSSRSRHIPSYITPPWWAVYFSARWCLHAQEEPIILPSTPSLRKSPEFACETIPILALSCSFEEGHQMLPLSKSHHGKQIHKGESWLHHSHRWPLIITWTSVIHTDDHSSLHGHLSFTQMTTHHYIDTYHSFRSSLNRHLSFIQIIIKWTPIIFTDDNSLLHG